MRQAIRAILFLAILIQHCPAVDAQKNSSRVVDVFLIGGQSNATGQGYMANLPAGTFIDTAVWLFHSGQPHLNSGGPADSWLPLHQASESPDRFGPELGFGTRLHQLLATKTIGLIKHAHSGTNLYSDWNPGTNADDTTHWGPQFKVFIQTVKQALEALRQKGYTPVIRGMIWQQGESDADKTEGISKQYGAHLAAFIHRVREQLQAPGMLFIYGYVLPPPVIYTGGAEGKKRPVPRQPGFRRFFIGQRSFCDTNGRSKPPCPGPQYPLSQRSPSFWYRRRLAIGHTYGR